MVPLPQRFSQKYAVLVRAITPDTEYVPDY